MNVCFVGAWDPEYPRNRVLRQGLSEAGVRVSEVRVPERRAVFRYPELAVAMASAPRADVLFVPAFRHKDVPLAKLFAGSRPLAFDPLVSRRDTLVDDWGLHARGSAQAAWNERIDRMSLRLPEVVLCDTWAHGRLFQSLGADPLKLHRVPVGAERTFFDLPDPRDAESLVVLYAGGFLPLHGVPVLIEALALLERERHRLPPFEVRLLGAGIEQDRARALAEQAGLERVRFLGRRPYAELPTALASAHVVLGAFGAGEKAGRVIPHKVWQGLAAGRAVLTGEGEGLLELFTPGEHLLTTPRGGAKAIAEALALLLRDDGLRARLGSRGRARALEIGTPGRLGDLLRGILEAVAGRA